MKVRLLKDNWTLTVLGDNVYHIPETPIETTVPSTVYETLLKKKLMPDPFYRDNELDATKLMENEFCMKQLLRLTKKSEVQTGYFYISMELTRLPICI